MTNPNIIKSFEIDAETLIKSNYTDSEEIINTLESNLEKGLISEVDFLTALNTVDSIEKGGKKAMLGELRMFGGRQYIKTAEGWKFHGKGTGAKAKGHVEGSRSKEADNQEDKEVSGDDLDAAYAKASRGESSPEEVQKVHEKFDKQKKDKEEENKSDKNEKEVEKNSYGDSLIAKTKSGTKIYNGAKLINDDIYHKFRKGDGVHRITTKDRLGREVTRNYTASKMNEIYGKNWKDRLNDNFHLNSKFSSSLIDKDSL